MKEPCSCYVATDQVRIIFCPLHKAAPDLLGTIRSLLESVGRSGWQSATPTKSERTERIILMNSARDAIAKAEATP
jgi:hypothetical protein